MRNPSAPEMTAIGGSATAFVASITLNEWAALAGILTAVGTFIFNAVYMVRKDRREQRETEATIAKLEGGQ